MTFTDWAVVSYKDDTGLGRAAADMRSVLQIGSQLVVPSARLSGHPLYGPKEVSFRSDFSDADVLAALSGLKGIIVLERPFHPRLLQLAKQAGLKTVCVPMWEWFSGTQAEWNFCDLFVCPSEFSEKVVRSYGWTNTIRIPFSLDVTRFPGRCISGPARTFIHNAGLVDADDRKGTRDCIHAFRKVLRKDVRLIVRLQKESELPEIDSRIKVLVDHIANPADLYAEGDVAIQPSKLEGIGFMVLEPLCTGLPVITLDYPPMNEYVRDKAFLVRKRWFKRRAFASQWNRQAHLRLPDLNDLARKIEWCATMDMTKASAANREYALTTFNEGRLKQLWAEAIASI